MRIRVHGRGVLLTWILPILVLLMTIGPVYGQATTSAATQRQALSLAAHVPTLEHRAQSAVALSAVPFPPVSITPVSATVNGVAVGQFPVIDFNPLSSAGVQAKYCAMNGSGDPVFNANVTIQEGRQGPSLVE